jgi:hypothetical protein
MEAFARHKHAIKEQTCGGLLLDTGVLRHSGRQSLAGAQELGTFSAPAMIQLADGH